MEGSQQQIHALDKANILSRILVDWVTPYINTSVKDDWSQDKHTALPKDDQLGSHLEHFKKVLKSKNGLITSVIYAYPIRVMEFLIFTIVDAMLRFSLGLLLARVVKILTKSEISSSNDNLTNIGLIFLALMIVNFSLDILESYYAFKVAQISWRIKTAVMAVLAEKAISFNCLTSSLFDQAKVANYLQVDAMNIERLFLQIVSVVKSLMNIFLGLAFIYFILKPAFYWISGIFLLFNLFNLVMLLLRSKFTKRLLSEKDSRVRFFENVLRNMEHVKLRALENYYIQKVFNKREREVSTLKILAVIYSISYFLDWVTPSAATTVVLLYYNFVGSAGFSFADFSGFIQIFETFKLSMMLFNIVIFFIIDISVSIGRMNNFLNSETTSSDYLDTESLNNSKSLLLKIRKGNFFWKSQYSNFERANSNNQTMEESLLDNPVLTEEGLFRIEDIELDVNRGERIMILGEAGSGKSSLLYSILGEMQATNAKTHIARTHKVGFIGQNIWTFADTIEKNITVGEVKEIDSNKLKNAVSRAQLDEDISQMPLGLQTEIGDVNDTLSGGQKVRVGLARCFYNRYLSI